MNGRIGERFRTKSRRKTRISSLTHPFQHFSRTDHVCCLIEHEGEVSKGGINITNLWIAVAEEEQELEVLVESLDKPCTRYKMEISAEKTKLMTIIANDIQREIKVKGQKLGTVTSFKYHL